MVEPGKLSAVFILWYVLEDDEFKENAKLIGVYRSPKDCNEAIERLKDKPGFRDFPEGFETNEYLLNKDHWTEGFVDGNVAAGWFDKTANFD